MGHELDDEGPPPNPQKKALVIVLVIVGVLLLLGVIGVGVMAALLAPALSKAKQKADATRCANNLRQLGIGAIQYSDDRRTYPHVPNDPTGRGAIDLLIAHSYIDADPSQLECPCDVPGSGLGYAGFTHAWSMNVRSTTPIAWDARPHPDGTRNVLHADASVQQMTELEFQQAMANLAQQVQSAAKKGPSPAELEEDDSTGGEPAPLDPLGAARLKADTTRCANNLRQLAIAAVQYSDDKRFYPYVEDDPTGAAAIQLLVKMGYVDNDAESLGELLTCPCGHGAGYEGFAGKKVNINARSTTPLLWDQRPHPDGSRNLATVDAAVVKVTAEEWPAILEQIEKLRAQR